MKKLVNKDNIDPVEILSPAGSFDALKQAIHNGCDAVYLGGKLFGARAFANNFTNEELVEAVKYAHSYHVKIYITVNTLIFSNEVDEFLAYIDFLVTSSVDALILQDLGMIDVISKKYDIPLHASTQLHNYDKHSLTYLKSLGISRAVIARETPIEKIAELAEVMDIEVFIHGALCMSYSGQCLFSAITQKRSGNRGRCAQNCRMKYRLAKICGEEVTYEKTDGEYLLSPKDLALLEDVGKLIDTGVKSLKIEGRMKPAEYVGHVTKIYADLVKRYYNDEKLKVSPQQIDDLQRLFNRGFTKGHILHNDELMSSLRPNHKGIYIGDVTRVNKNYITVALHKDLHQGDGIKFEQSDKGFICNKIYKKNMLVNTGYAGDIIEFDNFIELKMNDRLLLTYDKNLNQALSKYDEKKMPISLRGTFKVGENMQLSISDGKTTANATGSMVQQSKNSPLSREDLITNLSKLGNTPYECNDIKIDMDDNIFARKKDINSLRRDCVDAFTKIEQSIEPIVVNEYTNPIVEVSPVKLSISASVINEETLKACLSKKISRIYVRDYELYTQYKGLDNVFYSIDRLGSTYDLDIMDKILIKDLSNLEEYKYNDTIVSDYFLNVCNAYSIAKLHSENVNIVTLSVELNINQIKDIMRSYKNMYSMYPNTEVIVYGRLELMAIKHCIIGEKDCDKCKSSKYYLEDIHEQKYEIVVDNRCNNFIYDSKALNNITQISQYKNAGVAGYRLNFRDESVEEAVKLLDSAISLI